MDIRSNKNGAGLKMAQTNKITNQAGNSSSARNQSAKLNYERYLSLAQAEARSGNLVEAENCYPAR